MISGMSISIRLATGFGGFMPSHSLVPVTAPRLGRDSYSHPFSLFFSNEATLEEEESWGAQRDEEEEERNRKNRFKGKFVFSSMGIFNGVYREINGV